MNYGHAYVARCWLFANVERDGLEPQQTIGACQGQGDLLLDVILQVDVYLDVDDVVTAGQQVGQRQRGDPGEVLAEGVADRGSLVDLNQDFLEAGQIGRLDQVVVTVGAVVGALGHRAEFVRVVVAEVSDDLGQGKAGVHAGDAGEFVVAAADVVPGDVEPVSLVAEDPREARPIESHAADKGQVIVVQISVHLDVRSQSVFSSKRLVDNPAGDGSQVRTDASSTEIPVIQTVCVLTAELLMVWTARHDVIIPFDAGDDGRVAGHSVEQETFPGPEVVTEAGAVAVGVAVSTADAGGPAVGRQGESFDGSVWIQMALGPGRLHAGLGELEET